MRPRPRGSPPSAREPLRVLHVSQPVDGGVGRYVAALAADQERRGWTVVTACPAAGPLPADLAAHGVAHEAWPARREPGPGTLGEARVLAAIIRRRAPDVVHLHSSKAGLAGRLILRARMPTVFQPHAWSFDASGGALRPLAATWERLGAAWADVIACVSDAECVRGIDTGVPGRYRVVPTGVDLHRFAPPAPPARSAARSTLGLPPVPLAVCVGRLCRQKGQEVLLKAWPEVLERVPDAMLALVGDGPHEAALRGAAPPGVLFAGFRADPRPWLEAANVVVAPSRWEGLSLAVLEAMACARSVVASDAPGMRDALRGEAGAVVPVEDAGALAVAVTARLLDASSADAEGVQGRRLAEARPIEATFEKIAELYRDVLRRRGAPAAHAGRHHGPWRPADRAAAR